MPETTYSKGDQVTEEGDYVCVPCGFKKHLAPGETFPECMSCMAGTPDTKNEEFAEGMEMWEKVESESVENKTE